MGTIDLTIKEYTIGLNSNSDFDTELISGYLNSLVIDSNEIVSVTITSNLGYVIFHTSQHSGVEYYAPRAILRGAISNIIVQDQFDKFKLNESLNIRVNGPTNAEVKIILRLD